MDTPPTAPPPAAKPDLPAASIEAMGCLFFPGCVGKMAVAVCSLWLVILFALWFESLLEGRPMPWIQMISGNELTFVWCMLSLLNYHCIGSGKRRPWVFWLTVICLAGWCYIAFTSGSTKIGYPGASEADQLRAGRWLPTAIVGFVLLRFALSRKNRLYFGLLKA